MIELPIDPFVPVIAETARRARAVIVVAEPGAGKTTRVPPALIGDGPVILLQPRRVAARAIAQRIAAERGWQVGREVGWQIRLDRRFSSDTQLLVATEGILTTRFQQDPLLSAFNTVVLDEFHERSLHADLAIALARQARQARPDLRIVVMSATLDADSLSAYLDDCPIVKVPGRQHSLEIGYAPGATVATAARELLQRTGGDVLCFLPGVFEIRKAIAELTPLAGPDVDLVPLHGTLDANEQDRALRGGPGGRRRVVVSTNVAETSVTVPGVTAVVDSGLHKVARYDPERSIDSLTTERITADSAAQRAGRAGRIGPGVVTRLWHARDRLRPHREAEIHRVDLASAALDVIAWGGDPRDLEWFEAPPREALDAAIVLLERLGAVRSNRLTDLGRRVQALPIHPRLARMLIAAEGAITMARACALLSERHFLPVSSSSTSSDLLSAVDAWEGVPPHVERVAAEIARLASLGESAAAPGGGRPRALSEADFRRAVLAGYPDRVAQRRDAASPRVKLASGAGATIGPQSGVKEGEFLVALDVHAPTRAGDPDSVVRVASRVEREWLEPNGIELVHRFDPAQGVVRAAEVERYDALTLKERPVAPDPDTAAAMLGERWRERGPTDADVRLIARLKFAGVEVDLDEAVQRAAYGSRSLDDVSLERAVPAGIMRQVALDAPELLAVPSGRSVPLQYADDGTVSASVKLQELFGLGDTPRVGPNRVPVLFALLAPNGRPVQITRDLRSFWENTYPEVRKELRGRYPKHPWPEDPWAAVPTARANRRNR